jgi:Fe-S cluster assembly protein SufB
LLDLLLAAATCHFPLERSREHKPMSATVKTLVNQPYKYGFVTDIEADIIPRGLNEDVIRLISAKKNEPAFMLEFRLKAYRQWLKMQEPTWPNVTYPAIDCHL